MLKRMLWVLPLVLALSSTWLDAQNPERQKRPPQGATAPELDPKVSGAAVALLIGGALLLSERRRRRKQQSE
jgi:cytochrome c-type biogenesis protein CcmH/NrfF